jgi:Rieske Fe-S protein
MDGNDISCGRVLRRDLLRCGIAAAVSATLAASGGCALFVKKRDPQLTAELVGGEFQVPLASHPVLRDPGGSLVVAVAGRDTKVLVFRRPDGRLAALDMTCTHRGCDVEYRSDLDRIVCPCHGSEFDDSGANLKGPAERPLASHRVRTEGDVVLVTLATS